MHGNDKYSVMGVEEVKKVKEPTFDFTSTADLDIRDHYNNPCYSGSKKKKAKKRMPHDRSTWESSTSPRVTRYGTTRGFPTDDANSLQQMAGDTANLDLYYGATRVPDPVGPQGAQGAQGAQGYVGSTGPTGPPPVAEELPKSDFEELPDGTILQAIVESLSPNKIEDNFCHYKTTHRMVGQMYAGLMDVISGELILCLEGVETKLTSTEMANSQNYPAIIKAARASSDRHSDIWIEWQKPEPQHELLVSYKRKVPSSIEKTWEIEKPNGEKIKFASKAPSSFEAMKVARKAFSLEVGQIKKMKLLGVIAP